MTGKQWLDKWLVPPPSEVNQSEYDAVYTTLMKAIDGMQIEGASADIEPNDALAELAEQSCGAFVAAAEYIRKLIGDARYKEAQDEGLGNIT